MHLLRYMDNFIRLFVGESFLNVLCLLLLLQKSPFSLLSVFRKVHPRSVNVFFLPYYSDSDERRRQALLLFDQPPIE